MLNQLIQEDADELISFDPADLSQQEQYKLLAGSVVPRPIALVTTHGVDGPNAAPFSFFNVLSANPPMLMFSIGKHKSGRSKDTLDNLRVCPELVIHIVDEANAEKMNMCSEPLPADVNEMDKACFKTAKSCLVKPPRIIDLPVQFECVLEAIQPFGNVPYHLVIARVVKMHFRKDLINSAYHVNLQRLNPIARIAGPGMYNRTTDNFQLHQYF